MPRIGRLLVPDGIYHLIGRGLERRAIFQDVRDKQEFLKRLQMNLGKSEMQCLAWAVMPNHYHLLVRVGNRTLASLMQPLLTGFAGFYNHRHDRAGYVFQNRFQSILCEDNAYLLELIRYIHRNPLKSGLVPNVQALATYPWSGHSGVVGMHRRPWHSINEMLRYFHSRRKVALQRYQEFISSSDDTGQHFSGGGLVRSHGGWENLSRLRKEHVQCIGDERILGSSDFVTRSLTHDALAVSQRTRFAMQGLDLPMLIKSVCCYCGVDESRICGKSREGELSRAKALICYFGNREMGLTTREIASSLRLTQPAVSKWIRKGEMIFNQEKISMDVLSY